MKLELFDRLKTDVEKNDLVKLFLSELGEFIKSNLIEKDRKREMQSEMKKDRIEKKRKLAEEYRKEGHIYLVTEDRGNKIYVWDYTEKPNYEVEEFELPQETLKFAHEGTMLKFRNGKYELYSKKGYDKLFDEKNK